MRAASELPATGDAPLPSQEGKERAFNAFKTQRSLLGNSVPEPFPPAEAAPPLTAAPPPTLAQQQPPPPAPPEPAEKPDPAPPAPPKAAEPLKTVETPRTDDIAMRTKPSEAEAKVAAATPPPVKPAATPRPVEQAQQQAMLTTPAPKMRTSRDSGYQPEQEMNRIEGNISNRNKKSVDAVATPLAKYRKQVNDAIGSRWYIYVKDPERMSLIAPGSARVRFFIDANGQVVGIKLESNSSNASFADLCTSAVRDAREQIKDLKLPVDATLPLKDGRLECSLTFTFYNL
jgi:pyruvate/2-oxoglutarate dehydrogenase complex dihydrolipoamide acyltransferase (E2) component